ncbi:hypothetical protein ACWCYZ_39690 [Streptomyces virginiae]
MQHLRAAPQWRVIELITTGRVRLLAGDRRGATELLVGAVREARVQRLTHQLQCALSAASEALPDARESAEQGLTQLRTEMAA